MIEYTKEEHEMLLLGSHEVEGSDVDEYLCLECGRHFLIRWKPLKRYMIEEGNPYIVHVGAKGKISGQEASIEESPMLSQEFLDAINDLDFGEEE